MPRSGALAVALLFLVGLTVSGCGLKGPRTEGGYVGSDPLVTVVPVGQRKPAATISGPLLGADGKQTISTADFPGKIVVVNVWGSWCPPCRKEAPDLQAASVQTKDQAAFLGITTKDFDPAPAQAFVRAFKITYPSIYDPTGATLLAFGGALPPSAIPSTLVIDPQGRVAVRILSAISATTLVDIIHDVAQGR